MQELVLSNRYKILQNLGIGGFGLTYLAEDLHLPTRPRCVVKHLKPQISDAETLHLANRLFQQEAEILYRLGNHPNIPSLIAHFKENGEFYLVQEYIEGHTIAQEFTGGKKYNQKEMIQLIGQTLEILSFVHTQNVIHRDIKPANLIRRSSDGCIFLIDFGAVKQVNAFPQASQNSTFSTLTIGSHGYMPTEQMAGKPNFSSDLYALGLIAIEALTGTKPLALKQNNNTNEFIWAHRAQVSPEVSHFISKLVRYDFRQRFHSATEALNGLNVIASRVGFFQARNYVNIAPIAPNKNVIAPNNNAAMPNNNAFMPNNHGIVMNNHAVSAITLAPQVNVPSTPTLVALPNNNRDSFIPPTIIVQTENPQAFDNFQNLQPMRVNVNENFNASSSPKGSKVGIFVALMLVLLVGLVIAARTIVKTYSPPEFSQNSESPSQKESERTSQETITKVSDGSRMLFEEAVKQAEEARVKEKRATTKFEWEEIANKYKRAYGLLATIDQSDSYYFKAQEKIEQYKQKAQIAFEKSLNGTGTVPSNNNYPPNVQINNSPESYSTTTTTTTPKPSPKVNLTMPAKPSGQSYLAYNYTYGYDVRQISVNSDEALFTSKIANRAYNDKDSKAVVIEIRGGSVNATLEIKPPAYTAKLTPGSYSSVRELSYEMTGNYGISFSPMSCYPNGNHSFRINSIIYNELYNNLSLFDATFVLTCGNKKLMGRIRYDAR